MRNLTFLLLISLPKIFYGQNFEPFPDGKNTILVAPLNLLDLVNPSVQFGYERRFTQDLAYQIEVGLILKHSFDHYLLETDYPVNEGYKLRNEFKYFFFKERKVRLYVSAEMFYMQNKSNLTGTFLADSNYQYPKPEPKRIGGYVDEFKNDKRKYGFNLKVGFKFTPVERFMLESYIGIGVVYRVIKQYERENINDPMFDPAYPLSYMVPGGMWLVNVPLNLKLGYIF